MLGDKSKQGSCARGVSTYRLPPRGDPCPLAPPAVVGAPRTA